jgi:hypothetical protein
MVESKRRDEDVGLYIKLGRRYKKLTSPELYRLYDMGYPANGIWRIRDNSGTWIGEAPTPNRIKVQEFKELIIDVLLKVEDMKVCGKGISRRDTAIMILEAMAKHYDDLENSIITIK